MDLGNDGSRQGARENLGFEVVEDELLVGGMESKPRRQPHRAVLHEIEPLHHREKARSSRAKSDPNPEDLSA